ncbi:putative allophanate hydrolase subunit 2 [Escherichia coli]|uniref:Putative allophanate hydrolase subunit 2 n=1 Tax=Escherichia coli TaxID=562 RepID=A0A376LK57_ECOLX|nr:putative allophanate hydrolase subunit 2 [Escherichia coli]
MSSIAPRRMHSGVLPGNLARKVTAWVIAYRGKFLKRTTDRELLSHGLLPGVVQVPHNGQPIVLMNDAQTTGGYPRIACIIEADMYHLAQIPLGQPIHFVQCSLEEALKARQDQQRYFEQLAWRLHNEN